MNKLLESCLYVKNSSRFAELRVEAIDFRTTYIGNTILRDGVFELITRYAKSNNHEIKLLRFPIEDENVWAFTCIKNDYIFVTINTSISLNKQIFATAHELYHIYRYIDGKKGDFAEHGSLLTSNEVDNPSVSEEDCEANAFAALILAPKEQIEEQQKIKGKDFTNSDLNDLISFMDTFAMTYKAMVLKLFECARYNEEQVDILLDEENKNMMYEYMKSKDIGGRWLLPTYENNLDSIKALIEQNKNDSVLPEQRLQEDIQDIDEIINALPKRSN